MARLSRYVLIAIASLAIFAHRAESAFVTFTMEQVGGQADIQLGSTAQFRVLVKADTAITDLDGLDFNMGADDIGGAANRTAGGFFSSSVAPLFGGFSLPAPSSFLVFSGTGFPQTLDTNDVVIGELVLNTAGATTGTYNMSLSGTFAISTGFQPITTQLGNPGGLLTYNIVPSSVPEPSCLAVAALGLAAATRWRRRQ